MKYIILGLILTISSAAFAQEQQAQDSIPFEVRKQAYLYDQAMKYNDINVARTALYNLLILDPTNSTVLDSLAISYLDYNQYASAALVAQDAIAVNPEDLFATEIAAICFENLGVKNRAVGYYEKLYLANNNISTLYKVAFLQLDLKRFGEATSNADIIINSTEAKELKLLFPKEQNERQEISMQVAAIRLKGMIEEAKGNKEAALAEYDKALAIVPDFAVLKGQIKALKGEG
ncbi:MAG: hypothetical protein JXR10_08990 [Cyclobacteriaceae bacterium]